MSVGIVTSDPRQMRDSVDSGLRSSGGNFLETENDSYVTDSHSVSIKYVSAAMVDKSGMGGAAEQRL